MTIKITNSTQRQALRTVRCALKERRFPSRSETDWLVTQLDAIDARIATAEELDAERERQKQVADFDDVMGGPA